VFQTTVLRHAEREFHLSTSGGDLWFVSGTAEMSPQFIGTGANWHWDAVETPIGVTIWDEVRQMTATASLASIANEATAENAGWATDRAKPFHGPDGRIWLRIDLAVRDTDGHLARFAYHGVVLGVVSARVLLDDKNRVP
jgi:hypothetical protein